MINNISINNNNNNQNFTGLGTKLAQNIYPKACIDILVEQYPKSNGVVGTVPSDWIKNIPKEKRAKSIKKLYETFANNFSENSQNTKGIIKGELTNLFRKLKIIDKKEKISLEDAGEGSFGRVFKLTVGNYSYAVKSFFPKRKIDEMSYARHGNGVEQNVMQYISKQTHGNINVAKMFFGDVKSGYMLSKFIDKNQKSAKKIKDIEKMNLGMNFTDNHQYNSINSVIIDVGGVEPIQPMPSKNRIYLLKKFNESGSCDIEPILKRIQTEKNPNVKDELLQTLADCTKYTKSKNLNLKIINNLIQYDNRKALNTALDETLEDLIKNNIIRIVVKNILRSCNDVANQCLKNKLYFLSLNKKNMIAKNISDIKKSFDETSQKIPKRKQNLMKKFVKEIFDVLKQDNPFNA